MYMYQHVRLRSSHTGLQWHVACGMHGILVYSFNKQASHVLLSIQFDTNVSQLLRHVLSWSCDPLPSLGELSSSRLTRLSVCLSCLFWLCIPPAVYGRHILCLRCLRVALLSEKKGDFFIFFPIFSPQKWTPAIKKIKKQFSSVLTSAWRQLSYVSSTSPDNWRQSLTAKLVGGWEMILMMRSVPTICSMSSSLTTNTIPVSVTL